MTDFNEFNRQVIAEFRAHDGKVGGPFEGATMLILHTTGAKSGLRRETPLVCRPDGDAWAIFASKAGAPDNPDWYYNLVAHPDIAIEYGAETIPVRARVTEGDERSRIWEAQMSEVPQFAEYEAATDRTIPVVLLEHR